MGESYFYNYSIVCMCNVYQTASDLLIIRGNGNEFNARDLKELVDVVEQNSTMFVEAWNEYFS